MLLPLTVADNAAKKTGVLTLSGHYDKVPVKSNLKKEGFILAHSLKIQFIPSGTG